MSVSSQRDLSIRIRQDAITASLEAEAILHNQFVATCTKCMKHVETELLRRTERDFLGRNRNAATAQETLAYWRNQSDGQLPDIMRLFEPVIEYGSQPIFAAISLSTESAGTTLFIPVPYELLRMDAKNLKTSLWINANHSENGQSDLKQEYAEPTARTLSHALANISYAARINDKPIRAWLARAHLDGDAMYLPDVATLRGDYASDIISVSTQDEPYLGMASVLYLPIVSPQTPAATHLGAEAVIMLWSPIPRRWDGIFDLKIQRYEGTNAYSICDIEPVREYLWEQFYWLSTIVALARRDVRRSELEVVSFLLAFKGWAAARGKAILAQFKQFLHGSTDLLEIIGRSKTAPMPVRMWIDDLVRDAHGMVKELEGRWKSELPDCTLTLDLGYEPRRQYKALIRPRGAEYDQLIASIPISAKINFDREIAGYIAAEPAENISEYAEELKNIHIILTQKYVTLRYVERPTEEAKKRLVGSDIAFRRYYAGRRGLAVPPATAEAQGNVRGGGHGLWLYRVFEARAQVARKLYVSANGSTWYTDVVVPLCGQDAKHG